MPSRMILGRPLLHVNPPLQPLPVKKTMGVPNPVPRPKAG